MIATNGATHELNSHGSTALQTHYKKKKKSLEVEKEKEEQAALSSNRGLWATLRGDHEKNAFWGDSFVRNSIDGDCFDGMQLI